MNVLHTAACLCLAFRIRGKGQQLFNIEERAATILTTEVSRSWTKCVSIHPLAKGIVGPGDHTKSEEAHNVTAVGEGGRIKMRNARNWGQAGWQLILKRTTLSLGLMDVQCVKLLE